MLPAHQDHPRRFPVSGTFSQLLPGSHDGVVSENGMKRAKPVAAVVAA